MIKILKLLLFVSIILMIGCNGGGGGGSGDDKSETTGNLPTVEITGWYTENIDRSFWSKIGKDYGETAFFSISVNANDLDGIADIKYIDIINNHDYYWILRDDISGIDLYDPEKGVFIIRRCYNQDDPHAVLLGEYTAFVLDSADNFSTDSINFTRPGSSTGGGFIFSEDYTGSTNNGTEMLKRAIEIVGFKDISEITIIFKVQDSRVYNGYVWFFNESAEYITSSSNIKDIINSGSGVFTDGSSNILKIQPSDLNLGSHTWDDIQGYHIVLMDGVQHNPEESWDHRSISQYKSSLSPQKSISILEHRVKDAEYSKQLDKIIMISSDPNQIHIFDPISEENISVELNFAPNCVSVSPDGLYAVVGHDSQISYINLVTAVLEKILSVSTNVRDIILAGNGYVYAFSSNYGWESIKSINIESEIETQSTDEIFNARIAKLHPDGEAIYLIPGYRAPVSIEKYSIVNGTAEGLHGSPYRLEYAMCCDLWISEDGLRIFTAPGNIFRSSNDIADDMIYYGSLSENDSIEHMSDSLIANKIIAIPQSDDFGGIMDDTQIQIYAYDSLIFERSIDLPYFLVGDNMYPVHGKYVFINSDGTKYFAIIQADESSGMLYDYGLVIYNIN